MIYMDYSYWYDIARYYNQITGKGYTEKEVAVNAHEYCADYEYALQTGDISYTLRYIIDMLRLDRAENNDCAYWYNRIVNELQL